MNYVTILGLVAGTLTTSALLPQIIKIWKTKSAEDISLMMFGSLCLGVVLWLVYGILVKDLPLMIFNGIGLSFDIAVLILTLKYR